MSRSRPRSLVRGVVSFAALVILLVGPPVFLVLAVGWPLPTALPSFEEIRTAITIGPTADVVVKAIAVVAWIAWAQVAISFVVEVIARVHGRKARTLRTLPGVHGAIARLVAGTALAITTLAPARVGAAPAASHPSVFQLDLSGASGTDAGLPLDAGAFESVAPADPSPAPQPGLGSADRQPTVVVQLHDSYWDIAERTLGDGLRWREIRDLNVGRTMLDGHAVKAGSNDVLPGWELLLPADAVLPIETAEEPHPTAISHPGAASPARPVPPTEVTVQPGDNLWDLAETHLVTCLGRAVAAPEVAPYWLEFVETNRHRLVDHDNPDLIRPGQAFLLPAVTGSGPAPPTPGEASSEEAAPRDEPSDPEPAPGANPDDNVPSPTTPTTTARNGDGSDNGEAPEDDDEDSGVSEAATRVGVGAALASLVLGVLARRRNSRRRSLQSPASVVPRPPEDIETEREMARAANEDALAAAWGVARAFGGVLRANPLLPSVTGLVVRRSGDVALHLAEHAPPQPPFVEDTTGGPAWVLPAEPRDIHPDDGTADDGPILETVVSLGRTQAGDQVFVDLECLGAVTIDGPADAATALARSLAAQLALQPLDHYVDLVVVGIDVPQITEQGVVAAERLDETVVRNHERGVADLRSYLVAEDLPSTITARAQGLPRDGLGATAIVLGSAADPVLLNRLAGAALPGGRGLALVALDQPDHAVQLIVHNDGTVQVPHLGLTVQGDGLGEGELHRLDELIGAEPDTVSTPAATVPAAPSASDAHDAYEEPEWELCVRVLADHQVEVRTGEVVSFRYKDNPDVPSKNAHRGPELLAYLALRGDRSATLDNIRDDMWWERRVGRRTADTLVTATRKVVGGPRHLGYAQGDPTRRRYELAATVVTDVELLDQALVYARAVAATEPAAAIAALRPHLARIKAPPFRPDHLGGGLADWASGYRITDRIEAIAADAGLLAADLLAARGPDGAVEALWALDQALLVKPENEPLTCRAMQIEASLGNRDAADQRYRALTTLLARHELEPTDETTRLHREITSRTRIG